MGVSWLTDRSGKMTQGKYEITLGPWTWYGYADSATQAQAHKQASTCTCATNAVSYAEQHLDRLGSPPEAMWEAELPSVLCEDEQGSSTCTAAAVVPLLDEVEWSASWTLGPGVYNWTFYAFGSPYEYPDRNMSILATACSSGLDGVTSVSLGSAASSASVRHLERIAWDTNAQVLVFNADEANAATGSDPFTRFTLEVTEAGQYCIFTQHVPSEFLAVYLACETCTTKMLFPDVSRLHRESAGTSPDGSATSSEAPTPAAPDSPSLGDAVNGSAANNSTMPDVISQVSLSVSSHVGRTRSMSAAGGLLVACAIVQRLSK